MLGDAGQNILGRVTAVERRVDKDSSLTAALVSLPATAAVIPGVPVRGQIVVSTRPHAVVIASDNMYLYENLDAHVAIALMTNREWSSTIEETAHMLALPFLRPNARR